MGKLIYQNGNHHRKLGSINVDVDTLIVDLISNRPGVLKSEDDLAELTTLTYTEFLPRLLELCDNYNIKCTFFIIGNHALNKKNNRVIRSISSMGHEIANHTMNHYKHFANLSSREVENEIVMAEKILSDTICKPVLGFRAPGYVINDVIFQILIERGYLYDSSLLPSLVYNAGKYFYKYFLGKKDINILDTRYLFLKPTSFLIRLSTNSSQNKQMGIMEIPVNVFPVTRFPMISSVFSYFNYHGMHFLYSVLSHTRQILNFNLHDFEFINDIDLRKINLNKNMFIFSKKILRQPLLNRLHYFNNLFAFFNSFYKIIPLKDIALTLQKI